MKKMNEGIGQINLANQINLININHSTQEIQIDE